MALCVIDVETKDSKEVGIRPAARITAVLECSNKRAVCEEANQPGGNEPKKAKQRKEECKDCADYCFQQRDNLSLMWQEFYDDMGIDGVSCRYIEEAQRDVEITELHAECPIPFYPENSTPNVYVSSVGKCVRCVALISAEMQHIEHPSASYNTANNAVTRCTRAWIRFCVWLKAFVPFSNPRPSWTNAYNTVCPSQQFGPVAS